MSNEPEFGSETHGAESAEGRRGENTADELLDESADVSPDHAADTPLAAATRRADEFRDQYLRAVAELDNYRKRAARELEQARKYAIERFASELVGVADALEAGIKAGAGNPGNAVLAGAEATLRELHKAFEKAGIVVIDPAQQPFDPNWHEAMVAQPSADVAPNTIIQVIQKGYSLNGRLLRPARVIVSKATASGFAGAARAFVPRGKSLKLRAHTPSSTAEF